MENNQHIELQVNLSPRDAVNQNCIFPDAILYPPIIMKFSDRAHQCVNSSIPGLN